MSIYDHRDRPAYEYNLTSWEPYTNRNISKWWTEKHDRMIEQLIAKWQWHWYWQVGNAVKSVTPDVVITDYNKLMKFAITRANNLGLTNTIRKPQWKTCPLCEQRFVEDSIPAPFAMHLGMEHLDFCAPCLNNALFHKGDPNASKDYVLSYLRDLSNALNGVPSQEFGNSIKDLLDMDAEEKIFVLQVLKRKPETNCVKKLFGSWLNALIEAGILEDGTRRTSRGTQCLAKDGHVCLSLGEKTIDDLLFKRGISHSKEVYYPNENLRADFVVNDIFIEYLGFVGNPDYDAKTERKKNICKNHKINLILIYPKDLISSKKLEAKLSPTFSIKK